MSIHNPTLRSSYGTDWLVPLVQHRQLINQPSRLSCVIHCFDIYVYNNYKQVEVRQNPKTTHYLSYFQNQSHRQHVFIVIIQGNFDCWGNSLIYSWSTCCVLVLFCKTNFSISDIIGFCFSILVTLQLLVKHNNIFLCLLYRKLFTER